jgi:hypothetical protein
VVQRNEPQERSRLHRVRIQTHVDHITERILIDRGRALAVIANRAFHIHYEEQPQFRHIRDEALLSPSRRRAAAYSATETVQRTLFRQLATAND